MIGLGLALGCRSLGLGVSQVPAPPRIATSLQSIVLTVLALIALLCLPGGAR